MTSKTNTLRKYVEKFYNEVEGLNEETINEVAETQCIGSLTIARPIPICCKDGITHKHQQGQFGNLHV